MGTSALSIVVGELHREVVVGRRAVAAIGVAAAVACLALAAEARVYLPFTPVPITLQTFFVLVAGAALGPRLGTMALSSYLVLGTLGLPIFTGAWLGPTTGYLVGFVVAGWLIGALTRRVERASTLRIVAAMGAGNAVLLLLGAAHLALLPGVGVGKAIAEGVLPFLPGDALKLAAAAAFCRAYRDRLRVLFPQS
jgi:biotin transport system substrate-specific component